MNMVWIHGFLWQRAMKTGISPIQFDGSLFSLQSGRAMDKADIPLTWFLNNFFSDLLSIARLNFLVFFFFMLAKKKAFVML